MNPVAQLRIPSVTVPEPQPQIARTEKTAKALGLLLAGAAFFRFYGIGHGLSFHPDERHIIMVTQSLDWGRLNPNSFAYGSLPFYLLFFVSRGLGALFPYLKTYEGLFYLGRSLSAISGIIAVWLTFHLTRRICRHDRAAYCAAAFLGWNVFHIQNCHFFTVDGLLTTFTVGALLACFRLYDRPSGASALRVGLLIGLATATKISGLTLLLPAAMALALTPRSWGQRAKLGALVLLYTALSCVNTEPYALLDFPKFRANVTEQLDMVAGRFVRPYTLQYVGTVPFLYPLEQFVRYTVGWPLGITALGAMLWATLRTLRMRDPYSLITLCFVLPVFFAIAGKQVKFPRYLLPLYPAVFAFTAYALTILSDRLRPRLGRWSVAPWALCLVGTIGYAAAFLRVYSQPHPWVAASQWVFDHVPQGARFLGEHWDDRVPLSLPGKDARQYQLEGPEHTLPLYEHDSSQKIASISRQLASHDYIALATPRLYGSIAKHPERYPLSTRYYQLLFAGELGYQLIKTFTTDIRLGPLRFPYELSDESLSVYDHPKVVLFQNTGRKSAEEIQQKIATASERGLPTWRQMMLAEPAAQK